jgi:hypothetical protein
MIKKNPLDISREVLDISKLRKDLYVIYYDEKDSAIHLDIKAAEINKIQNKNPLCIPLLLKTLATATQMMTEDYLTMMQMAVNEKQKGAIHITDAIPKPS